MAIGIGETLRAARHQRGRSIADAAAATRVRESYLAALEQEDFDALGGDVYVKGFLRSYAKYLGLDPEPLLAAYRREHQEFDEASAIASAPVAPMRTERPPGIAFAAVGAVVLLVILVVVSITNSGGDPDDTEQAGNPSPVEQDTTEPAVAPPVERTAPPAPTPTTTPPPPTEQPTAPVIPPGENVEVTLAVTGAASWMRVTVDGDNVFEGEVSNGSTETYTGDDTVQVRIGDASAVTVTVNGQQLGTLGGPGEVVERTYSASGTVTTGDAAVGAAPQVSGAGVS